MLKIEKVNLIANDQIVRSFTFCESINYVQMGNSKGKTSLFLLIDYLLASSTITLSKETFSGIEFVELHTNHGVFVRKTLDQNYYGYKLREKDGYRVVSADYYKSQIENACLNGIFSDRDAVRELAEEDVSFRTYTLFNFLDEHFLGQIEKNIFSKQMLFEYYRGKFIFDYIFNKTNIQRISMLKKEIEELSRRKAKIIVEREIYNSKTNRLSSLFADLGIDFRPNSMQKNLDSLFAYENNLLTSNSKIKGANDYYYLWDVLNNINNSIRKLKEQKLSSKNQNELNEKRIVLLNSLKNLYDGTESDEILSSIEEVIKKCETIGVAANNSDYDEAISELEKRKKEMQKEVYNIKAANSSIDVDSKRSKVAEAKTLLQDILSFNEKDDANSDELIKIKKKEIRELRNNYDMRMEKKVSDLINHYYSSLKDKNYVFVKQDYDKDRFRLAFNYKKMMVCGYTTIKSESGDEYEVVANLESMSRQTAIQLCTYFAFAQLCKENFQFPILGTLFLDNVSKPFEEANKPLIHDLLITFVNEVKDYNVIVTTDCSEGDEKMRILYEDGLNPLYKK